MKTNYPLGLLVVMLIFVLASQQAQAQFHSVFVSASVLLREETDVLADKKSADIQFPALPPNACSPEKKMDDCSGATPPREIVKQNGAELQKPSGHAPSTGLFPTFTLPIPFGYHTSGNWWTSAIPSGVTSACIAIISTPAAAARFIPSAYAGSMSLAGPK